MRVRMTEDAIQNYGEHWRNVVLVVTATSRSKKEHPGYDEGVSPTPLYDLKRFDNGVHLPMSLYKWEVEEI